MLSLSDIQNAPTDLTQLTLWAQRNGHIPMAAPPPETPPLVPPATVTAPMSPVTAAAQPKSEVAPMTAPSVTGTPDVHHLGGMPESDIGGASTAVKPMVPPKVGSAAESGQELSELEAARKADTLASHPTFLGKLGHIAGRVGSIAGAAVAPGVTAMIPGSQLNLNLREAGLKGELAQRTAAESAEKEREGREKNVESEEAKREEETKQLKEAGEFNTPDKRQDYMQKNPGLFEDMSDFEKRDYALSGKFPQKEPPEPKTQVTAQQHYSDAVDEAIRAGRDPHTDPAVQNWADAIHDIEKTGKPDEDEKKVKEVLGAKNWEDTPANRLRAREVLKELGKTPEDEETRQLKKEILQDRASKLEDPSNDEQRRADLGRNMLLNIDGIEEIAKRRPDLFGKFAGRWTQLKHLAGTDDQDIAKLYAIKEYLGMASVGAHSMRNAQHVETAADAILNAFKNSPEAVIAAGEEGRKSVGSFLADEQRNRNRALKREGGGGGGAAATTPKAGALPPGWSP